MKEAMDLQMGFYKRDSLMCHSGSTRLGPEATLDTIAFQPMPIRELLTAGVGCPSISIRSYGEGPRSADCWGTRE
jgi:hypothetical protein